MVREANLRKTTWDKKLQPKIIGELWENIKPIALEQVSTGLDNMVEWEQKAKKVIEKYGVEIFLHPQYINFARELGEISKKFTKPTLNKEASALAQKWVLRGLDGDILKEIGKEFGIDIELIIKFFEPKTKIDKLTQPKRDMKINLSFSPQKLVNTTNTFSTELLPPTETTIEIIPQPKKDLQINLNFQYSIF